MLSADWLEFPLGKWSIALKYTSRFVEIFQPSDNFPISTANFVVNWETHAEFETSQMFIDEIRVFDFDFVSVRITWIAVKKKAKIISIKFKVSSTKNEK